MIKRIQSNILTLGAILLAVSISGCSVGMALSGKETKDVSVLATGAHWDSVIAKIGPPQTTITESDGTLVDTWDIVKGNAPSAGRAVAHGAMDFMTLGLWEVVGTPVEMVAGSEKHTIYTVRYDGENKVKNMSVSEESRQAVPTPKPASERSKGTTPTT